MGKEQIADILKREHGYLHSVYGVGKIALFGSFASGTESDKSDVDLLIEFDRPLGFEFFRLNDHLEKALGRKVEILTPDGLNSIRIPAVTRSIRENLFYVL
ncbi:MAG: nucleotidyltransferase domain-containing protein [Elusimicrobiales bacterium]|nr:nucleotidyltransferase domain-containing protein [Elusimicrobiales bacterium]